MLRRSVATVDGGKRRRVVHLRLSFCAVVNTVFDGNGGPPADSEPIDVGEDVRGSFVVSLTVPGDLGKVVFVDLPDERKLWASKLHGDWGTVLLLAVTTGGGSKHCSQRHLKGSLLPRDRCWKSR